MCMDDKKYLHIKASVHKIHALKACVQKAKIHALEAYVNTEVQVYAEKYVHTIS